MVQSYLVQCDTAVTDYSLTVFYRQTTLDRGFWPPSPLKIYVQTFIEEKSWCLLRPPPHGLDNVQSSAVFFLNPSLLKNVSVLTYLPPLDISTVLHHTTPNTSTTLPPPYIHLTKQLLTNCQLIVNYLHTPKILQLTMAKISDLGDLVELNFDAFLKP